MGGGTRKTLGGGRGINPRGGGGNPKGPGERKRGGAHNRGGPQSAGGGGGGRGRGNGDTGGGGEPEGRGGEPGVPWDQTHAPLAAHVELHNRQATRLRASNWSIRASAPPSAARYWFIRREPLRPRPPARCWVSSSPRRSCTAIGQMRCHSGREGGFFVPIPPYLKGPAASLGGGTGRDRERKAPLPSMPPQPHYPPKPSDPPKLLSAPPGTPPWSPSPTDHPPPRNPSTPPNSPPPGTPPNPPSRPPQRPP